LYGLTDKRFGILRVLWLGPIALFLKALTLTQSRGGALGLVAALLIAFRARFGWVKTGLIAGVVVPILLAAESRQARIGLDDPRDTGQQRMQKWMEGFQLFLHTSPYLGIGADQYAERMRPALHAHNSYVQAYVELGFIGGAMFCGAFFFTLWPLERLSWNRRRAPILDPELRRMQPFVMGMLAGFMMGTYSLTRTYVLVTYLVLGVATVFLRQVATYPPLPDLRCRRKMALRLAAVGVLAFVFLYSWTKFMVRWEGHKGL
jgi:O-antigen ligase